MPNDKPAMRMTQTDMLLIAFHRVAKGTTQKVPYEELVLQAWRDFPETFSMRNHPEHPDASDVHKKLYNGTLKMKGLVVSLGNKVFRLTDKGLARASELIAAIDGRDLAVSNETSRLGRAERNFIDHALRSRAFQTWREGQCDKLVDYDARVLFQFSTGTKLDERRRKVSDAIEAIRKACALKIEGAEDLQALAEFLIHNFDELLKEA